jgi:exosortase
VARPCSSRDRVSQDSSFGVSSTITGARSRRVPPLIHLTLPAHRELVHLPIVSTSSIPTPPVTAAQTFSLPKGNAAIGLAMLLLAVVARYAADLAAELFVMRCSMILAAGGLVVCYGGFRQLLHWWLPFTLLTLSVPIPEVILNSVALPLQFTASKIGAALLETRDIPIRLSGNVILMAGKVGQPPQQLFVAEACSGLRSLTALISLGVLLGALFLRAWPLRVLLIALTIPVAILINGVRIFITGFLVYFVSPEMGQGFMHTSEGMIMFGGAFLITAMITWAMAKGEDFYQSRKVTA